jgi:hypothetical protein
LLLVTVDREAVSRLTTYGGSTHPLSMKTSLIVSNQVNSVF